MQRAVFCGSVGACGGGGLRLCRCGGGGGLPWGVGFIPTATAMEGYLAGGRSPSDVAATIAARGRKAAMTREIHVFYEAWALGNFNERDLWPVVYKDVARVDALEAAINKEFDLPGGSKLLMQIGKFWQPFHAVEELPDGEIWVAVKDPESPKTLKEDSNSSSSGDNEQESPAVQKKKTRRGTKAGRQVKERRIKATAKREAKAIAALATPAFNAPPPPPFGYMAPAMKGACSFYVDEMEQTPEGVATLPEGLVADA